MMDAWEKLLTEINSIKLVLQRGDTQRLLSGDKKAIHGSAARDLEALAMFATRAAQQIRNLAAEEQVPVQEGDDMEVDGSLRGDQITNDEKHHLGNTVKVRFTTFGDIEVDAKVDSGATTSSLHADDIQQSGGQLSFTSSALGDKRYTVDFVGSQEVHSADGGAKERPMIKVDIEVDGVPLNDVVFNLNDRSNMESPVLLGENVLKAGNFVVDVSKDSPTKDSTPNRDQRVIGALETLSDAGITLNELVEYLQTIAIRKLKD